jgi:hypothetical protein
VATLSIADLLRALEFTPPGSAADESTDGSSRGLLRPLRQGCSTSSSARSRATTRDDAACSRPAGARAQARDEFERGAIARERCVSDAVSQWFDATQTSGADATSTLTSQTMPVLRPAASAG